MTTDGPNKKILSYIPLEKEDTLNIYVLAN